MVEEGADIIDVGGESTRPGAGDVPRDEELRRVIPVIKKISASLKVPVSIDTRKADVAVKALDAGADIINDVSGLRFDKRMAGVAAKANCPVIVMHIKGSPKDMQEKACYESLMDEVIEYLAGSIETASLAGVEEDKIVIDPGIGFGKSLKDNLNIIKNLSELKVLGRPILVGLSRKSFIGRLTGTELDDRLEGTISASVLSIAGGAHILRVHDIKEARRAARIADAILKPESVDFGGANAYTLNPL